MEFLLLLHKGIFLFPPFSNLAFLLIFVTEHKVFILIICVLRKKLYKKKSYQIKESALKLFLFVFQPTYALTYIFALFCPNLLNHLPL